MATRKPSDPVERALRLFTILQLLAARRPGQRFGRADLALACECSVKTIGRELLILKSHIPLDYDPVAKTYGLPDKGWALTTSALNGSDVLILALARSLLADEATPFAAQVQTTLDKIMVGLPPALRQLLTEASQTVRATGGPARDYSHAPVALMQRAAARQQTVEMLYDSRNSNTCERRLVDPYLVEKRDGRYWEMHARCHRDNRVKTFALDRVLESRTTGQKFIRGDWDESSKGVFGGIRGEDWVEIAYSLRFWFTSSPLHVCFHEYAHLFQTDSTRNLALTPRQKTLASSVSIRAGTNVEEFLCEVYAGLIEGVQYDSDIMRAYHRSGGRRP